MKRLFLLLALVGMVAVGCTEGGVDDNINNGGNNTEQPGGDDDNINNGGNNTEQPGEDDDDENKEDGTTFITDSEGNVVVEAEGGEVVVTVTTDIEYSVEIPEEAQSWLCVADTRAIRMEKLTFTVADNDTFEERSANVELVDSDGKSLQTINFTQLAKSNVMANNEIWYTTTDNKRIILPSTEPTVFGAYFISNTYSDGKGVLTFDGEITKIGNGAFKDIRNLASITIPDSVTSIGDDAFYECTSLTSVTIGKGVTSIGYKAFYGYTGELIVNCNIPSASRYENGAFYGSEFTRVTIGDSVSRIGKYAFYDCTGELIVNCNIPSATDGSNGAFYGADFTEVTIGDGVTSIGDYAFSGCDLPTSITIPISVTTIGEYAFYGCTGELIVNCNIPSATDGSNGAFFGAYFTEITIGDGVTSIGDYAFAGCIALESVTIPDSVTSIGDEAFCCCTSLESVTIGNGVTKIGSYAFYDCGSLEEVYCKPTTPPTGGDEMFYNNASGRKIYVPTESVNAYKSAWYWSFYADYIEGYDF